MLKININIIFYKLMLFYLILKMSKKLNYTQLLKNKVRELMKFMRAVYKGINNSIYEQLNEEYEEEMVILIGMVPSDWCIGLHDSLDLVWDIVKTVNITKLADAVEKHGRARFWFSINSFNLFYKNCVLKNETVSAQEAKATKNILDKLIPVFNAIDEIVACPEPYLRRIALLYEEQNDNNNILKGFM